MKMNKNILVILSFIILLVIIFALSFYVGKYPIKANNLVKLLFNSKENITKSGLKTEQVVLFNIRLPRIVACMLVGGGLSAAGLSYQVMFQNPMVSPDVLGASAGAAFGAAIGILLDFSSVNITISSFFCGLLAVALAALVSRFTKSNPILGLVLGGIMVGSLFSSGISFIKLIADPNNTLPAITYWLMGSMASITAVQVKFLVFPIIIGLIPLVIYRWKMNVMSFGDYEARAMGVNTSRVRILVIFGATLITAASVSVCGMVGWIGLVIPHLVRMIVGCDMRITLPISILLGGSFLLLVDDLARTITTGEIPLGILTSFVGAPFFIYLMIREGKHNGL